MSTKNINVFPKAKEAYLKGYNYEGTELYKVNGNVSDSYATTYCQPQSVSTGGHVQCHITFSEDYNIEDTRGAARGSAPRAIKMTYLSTGHPSFYIPGSTGHPSHRRFIPVTVATPQSLHCWDRGLPTEGQLRTKYVYELMGPRHVLEI